MKKILVIIDGIVGKTLLQRVVQIDTSHSLYDIVYMNDNVLCSNKPLNFTFYKFDPTSFSKLKLIMTKVNHTDTLVVMSNKDDTLSVVENISQIRPNLFFTVYNQWNLVFDNPHIQNYNSLDVISNGLIEKLPNIPVTAQNIGLKQGEIMEIKISFGSSYAYRYIGSIAQKEWKIFALYRNNTLISAKATVILKPNDIVLIIGKPKVLIQVYNAVSKSHGNFPMPFGKNIYVYIDLYLQTKYDALNSLKKARFLVQKLNNSKLIIKITRPTTIAVIDELKDCIKDIKDQTIEFDYYFTPAKELISSDKKRFDIGLIILTNTLLDNHKILDTTMNLKIPIFKVGTEDIKKIKTTVLLLNNTIHYEQISPIVFDINSQLKYKIDVIDSDPIGDVNRTNLIEHLQNLSKIFNHDIKLDTNNKNPINQLIKEKNRLQILPIQKQMKEKRLLKFFTINSDLLSYDLKSINQILIPIIENQKEENE